MTEFVLIGPPGAGKGTQGRRLAAVLNVPHISTGEMLRQHVASETILGICVQAAVANGELIPDDMMLDLLRSRVAQADCAAGYILDGFPRTIEQATSFDAHFKPTAILFEVSESNVLRRIASRNEGRTDDKEMGIVRERLRVYQVMIQRVISFYEEPNRLIRVDGNKSIDEITEQLGVCYAHQLRNYGRNGHAAMTDGGEKPLQAQGCSQ